MNMIKQPAALPALPKEISLEQARDILDGLINMMDEMLQRVEAALEARHREPKGDLREVKVGIAIELLHQKAENEGFVAMPRLLLDRFHYVERKLDDRLQIELNAKTYLAACYHEIMDNIHQVVKVAYYQSETPPSEKV